MRPPKTLIEQIAELLQELEGIKSKPGHDEMEQLALVLESVSIGLNPDSAKARLKKISWHNGLSFEGATIQDVFEARRIREQIFKLTP